MIRSLASLALSLALLLLPSLGTAAPAKKSAVAKKPTAGQLEFFEKRIRPVLVSKCYSCHSADAKKVEGNLLLDTREGIRRGGENGHAIVPGDVDGSLLIEAIRHESFEMPEEKLPERVINDFVKWVEMGAPDPRDGAVVKVQRKIDFKEAKEFWAFQPPKGVKPPAVSNKAWPRDDIDRFVLARLESQGLTPVADAERRVLIRRVYFDLVGYPPSPADVEKFLADDSPGAFAKVVDSLLDSPQFGERWGRHWLDVARFAESSGKERNYAYPQAWRYRNYVFDAFNADKPYDEFIREQVAGDLLPAKTTKERNEHLVATGFLAIGPRSLNERDRAKFIMDTVDEQIDVTSRAVMALSIACARCHDHKFDPIPTKEYYAIAGIFRSTNTLYGTARGRGNRQAGGLIPLTTGDKAAVATKPKPSAAKSPAKPNRGEIVADLKQARKELARLTKGGKKNKKGKAQPADAAKVAKLRRRVRELQQALASAGGGGKKNKQGGYKGPSGPACMGVQEGNVADCPLHERGDTKSLGAKVDRGFLTVLPYNSDAAPPISDKESGRRQLAHWLTDRENPLTARVFVNRAWHHLFGRGIVASVDNFGVTGDRPTHPMLLDHLAVRFMEEDWSVKKLVRALVLSRTYQMSSNHHAGNYEKDPENLYVWRMSPRRLDAESIRDAVLAVSGQLDLERPKGSTLGTRGGGEIGRGAQITSTGGDATYRSVYLPVPRNAVPTALRLFDFAEPSMVVGRRDVTTVPAQALYMMNSPFIIEQSEHFARRLLEREDLDRAGRVELAYRLAFSRQPASDELQRALDYIEKASASLGDGKTGSGRLAAWASFCQALYGSAEFRYVE